MTDDSILNKIKTAFVNVLEYDNFELTHETTANDVDGWDSVTHLLIINNIESVYGIKFKLMDLMSMENVGDLINAIKKEISQ